MRKIYIGLAFSAMLVFSAVVAASALAAPEFLDGGNPISAAIPVLTTLDTGLQLEDKGNGVEAECKKGEGEGTVGPGNKDTVKTANCTEVNKTAIKGGGTCLEVVSIKGANLEWQTELVLVETGGVDMYYIIVLKEAGGNAGWAVTCKTFLGNVTDTCTGPAIKAFLVENVLGGELLAETDALTEKEVEENSTCSVSGGKGSILAGADLLVFSMEGLELTVSG